MSTDHAHRPPFKIIPIKKVDVFRSLLEQLEAYIEQSDLKPGDRLGSERELAEQFQVSRVSVREALRALESLGKIEIRRNAGSFILNPNAAPPEARLKGSEPVDESFLEQLVDVRSAVEAKVVALVAARSKVNLDDAREVLDRVEDELQHADRAQGSLDLRFEAALARECGNPLLARFQQLVHELWIDTWSELGVAPGDWGILHEQHRAILTALEAGDRDAAIALMIDHTDRSLDLATGLERPTSAREASPARTGSRGRKASRRRPTSSPQ